MVGLVASALIAIAVALSFNSSTGRLMDLGLVDTSRSTSGKIRRHGVHYISDQIVGRFRRAGRRTAARSAAVELIASLAAELRAGQPARPALERAAHSAPLSICQHAVGAARLGGDVPAALRRDSDEHGLPALRSLAALWQVGEGSGAGLAEAADRLAAAESSGEAVRRELSTQLAGPRATARVLAGLPILGLLLGSGLGASPLDWLTGTPWGLIVLVAGIALEVVGMWWTSRMMKSVEALL